MPFAARRPLMWVRGSRSRNRHHEPHQRNDRRQLNHHGEIGRVGGPRSASGLSPGEGLTIRFDTKVTILRGRPPVQSAQLLVDRTAAKFQPARFACSRPPSQTLRQRDQDHPGAAQSRRHPGCRNCRLLPASESPDLLYTVPSSTQPHDPPALPRYRQLEAQRRACDMLGFTTDGGFDEL